MGNKVWHFPSFFHYLKILKKYIRDILLNGFHSPLMEHGVTGSL